MFTGLIESLGTVTQVDASPAGIRLGLRCDLAGALAPGDSVAVNGVCLTVVHRSDDRVEFDVSPETARVSSLGRLAVDGLVNLERPLRADARLGGHFVQGHVDDMGVIEAIQTEGEFYRLAFSFPPSLTRYLISKGSVAVDGISLTVAEVDACRFAVQIIPHTWMHTNLQSLAVGERVNLECDMLGKYVLRMLEHAELVPRDPSTHTDLSPGPSNPDTPS